MQKEKLLVPITRREALGSFAALATTPLQPEAQLQENTPETAIGLLRLLSNSVALLVASILELELALLSVSEVNDVVRMEKNSIRESVARLKTKIDAQLARLNAFLVRIEGREPITPQFASDIGEAVVIQEELVDEQEALSLRTVRLLNGARAI